MVARKMRTVLVALSVAVLGVTPGQSNACCFWRSMTTANYAPAPVCNTCNYAPQVAYRTVYTNVPVTTMRPISTVNPCTGCPVTTLQPVTTYRLTTAVGSLHHLSAGGESVWLCADDGGICPGFPGLARNGCLRHGGRAGGHDLLRTELPGCARDPGRSGGTGLLRWRGDVCSDELCTGGESVLCVGADRDLHSGNPVGWLSTCSRHSKSFAELELQSGPEFGPRGLARVADDAADVPGYSVRQHSAELHADADSRCQHIDGNSAVEYDSSAEAGSWRSDDVEYRWRLWPFIDRLRPKSSCPPAPRSMMAAGERPVNRLSHAGTAESPSDPAIESNPCSVRDPQQPIGRASRGRWVCFFVKARGLSPDERGIRTVCGIHVSPLASRLTARPPSLVRPRAPIMSGMNNAQIADAFDLIADLLEIQAANPFRVRAYRRGARVVREWPESLARVAADEPDRLTAIEGIGRDLAEKIQTLIATGSVPLLGGIACPSSAECFGFDADSGPRSQESGRAAARAGNQHARRPARRLPSASSARAQRFWCQDRSGDRRRN